MKRPTGEYGNLGSELKVQRFQVYTVVMQAAHWTMKPVYWDGADWAIDATKDAVHVYASIGSPTLNVGDQIWAVWKLDSRVWELISTTASSPVDIVEGYVNDTDGVLPTDPTFNVDGVLAIVGTAPGATISGVQNTWGDSMTDNQKVYLIKDVIGSQWEVIEIKREKLEVIIRIELYEDKAYGQTPRQAKKVIWDGANYVVTGDPFNVVDTLGIFGPSKSGYRGWAIQMSDRTDVYEIIWLEAKARFVQFTLNEDYSDGVAATANNWWGHWPYGKDPRTGGNITVYDDTDTWDGMKSGTKGMAILAEDEDKYYAIPALNQGKAKVNQGDALDYLEDQFTNETADAFSASSDVPVFTKTTGADPKIDPYAAMDAVPNWSGSGLKILVKQAGGGLYWLDVIQTIVIKDYNFFDPNFQVKEVTALVVDSATDWITRHRGQRCEDVA